MISFVNESHMWYGVLIGILPGDIGIGINLYNSFKANAITIKDT